MRQVNGSAEAQDTSATPRPYHHGRLREALLAASLELARAGGPEAVVLRAVSRAAGVSHNAGYRHFADQEDLLAATSELCMAELATLMTERMAALPASDPVESAWSRLRAIGRAYVEFAVQEPGWFRTAFVAAAHAATEPNGGAPAPMPSNPQRAPHHDAHHDPQHDPQHDPTPDPQQGRQDALGPYDLLSERLDELVSVGAIPAQRRPGAEYAAWAAVHGLSSLLVEGPLQALPPQEAERALDIVLTVVCRGL